MLCDVLPGRGGLAVGLAGKQFFCLLSLVPSNQVGKVKWNRAGQHAGGRSQLGGRQRLVVSVWSEGADQQKKKIIETD